MDILQLITAKQTGKQLKWNDPEPLEGNDYKVSEILTDIESDTYSDYTVEDWEYTTIFITYNDGQSEAEVFINELEIIG